MVSMNGTLNCTFLNTDVETIDATYTHLPTPLAEIPNFTFYIYTKRQGKGNNFGHFANIALDEKQIEVVFKKNVYDSFFWATNTPVLYFWLLLWVSKPKWSTLFILG